jgi:hypothetical protein
MIPLVTKVMVALRVANYDRADHPSARAAGPTKMETRIGLNLSLSQRWSASLERAILNVGEEYCKRL